MRAMYAAMPWNDADGRTTYSLAFSRVGTGPAIVFLHGLASNRRTWDEQVQRLRARYTVLTVDLPGHGESPAVDHMDLACLGASVAALIRSEGVAPAVVVGHSMGGTVAAWVAHAAGPDVCGLVIVDSSLRSMNLPPEVRAQCRAAMNADHEATLRQIFGPSTSSPEQAERVVADARPITAESLVGYLDALATQDASPRNSELGIPVHAMMSSRLVTELDRPGLERFGYAGVRRLTWTAFPASRHYLFWDEPQRFADDLDAVLDRFSHEVAGESV